MKPKTVYAILIALIIIVGVVAFHVGRLTAPVKVVEVEVSPKPPREIRIGATLAISGPFAAEWGPPYEAFLKEWEKMINEKGGIYVREYGTRLPVKLIVYDDKSSPDKSAELYERLITVDHCDILLGPAHSAIAMRASTVAEKYKVPMVGPESLAPALFARGYRYWTSVLNWPASWSKHYWDLLSKTGWAKTIVIAASALPHRRDVGEAAVDWSEKIGLKVLSFDVIPTPCADFGPYIIKYKALNPDIVYLSLAPGEELTFLRQAKEMGLKPREFHNIFGSKLLVERLGADVVEGLTGESYFSPKYTGEGMADFMELQRRLNMTAYDYPWFAIRFPCLQIIVKAIEEAGTLDKEKLRDTIMSMHIMTIYGEWYARTVEYKGQILMNQGTEDPLLVQIQKGSLVVIWPPEYATGKYIYPGVKG
jgi:branched-chain amino acid transport system substrate-binding protein